MVAGDAFQIASAVVLAVGGGAALVAGLSSWLGKLWAERFLSHARNELDIFKDKHLRAHADKMQIYRQASDLIADILGDLEYAHMNNVPIEGAEARMDRMNRGRMRVYAYMAMLAPQPVMDALDNLFDHLLLVVGGHEPYEWPEVRRLSLALLNEVRKDIGTDASPIEYRGAL